MLEIKKVYSYIDHPHLITTTVMNDGSVFESKQSLSSYYNSLRKEYNTPITPNEQSSLPKVRFTKSTATTSAARIKSYWDFAK